MTPQLLFSLISCLFLALVSANTEKVIFTAPEPIRIPLSTTSLSDLLKLDVLSPETLSIRRNLSRTFPVEPKNPKTGEATWLLLEGLNPGQRYELRVCWSALQPTGFHLEAHELNHVWATPELVQSLSDYAYSRIPNPEDDEGPSIFQLFAEADDGRDESVLLVQVQASADYFSDDAALMKDPPPVLVDLILDPYLYNILPRSLVPTVGYVVLVGIVTWIVARRAASALRSIADKSEDTPKKRE